MEKQTWKHKVRPIMELTTCLGIELSDGSIALIDFEDRAIVEGWNWSANKTRSGIYAQRGDGNRAIRLHNEIAGPKSDHKNRNTLDNRRSNLRPATAAQNSQNRRCASNNKSGFKGVSFRSDRGTWLATIRKRKIGTFRNPEAAARAYDAVAAEVFGEFAVFNFPANA